MKILKTALVLTLVGIICGVLIGVANFVTAPIIEKNAQARAMKAYKSFFDLDNMEEVDLEGTVYQQVKISKDSNLIGYVYKAKGTNQRGLIDLAVGVKLDGTITGIKILESENTAGFYDQYIDSANNTLKGLKGGESALTLAGIDNITGVTQSGELIDRLLKAVTEEAKKHIEEPVNPVDPYEEVFGEYESKEEDSAFTTTETLTKKEIIKDTEGNVIGFAYTATGTREGIPYHDGPARVTLLVGVKEDGTVLGVYKLKVEHTASYFSYHDPFFENLKGKNISEYETVDTVAGATVSWGLIKELLDAVKAVS